MKNALKLLTLVFVVFVSVVACSKDDDPVDNDLFIGQYKGTISFLSKEEGSEIIGPLEGTVTVSKVGGSNYTFMFSNDMQDINNITMSKGDNNNLIIEDNALGLISIDDGKLSINYTDEDGTWSANCTRD